MGRAASLTALEQLVNVSMDTLILLQESQLALMESLGPEPPPPQPPMSVLSEYLPWTTATFTDLQAYTYATIMDARDYSCDIWHGRQDRESLNALCKYTGFVHVDPCVPWFRPLPSDGSTRLPSAHRPALPSRPGRFSSPQDARGRGPLAGLGARDAHSGGAYR